MNSDDNEVARAEERERIAGYLRTVALNSLHDLNSDAVDGYVAATLIELAKVIENNGIK